MANGKNSNNKKYELFKRVLDSVNLYKSHHNPGELNNGETQNKLDTRLDLKPKLRGKTSEEAGLNYQRSLKESCERKRKKCQDGICDWERDFEFYVD